MGDADIALRHIARRRAAELARVFVVEGSAIEIVGWLDTQVTSVERRLDNALHLRVAGESRILHFEFCFALRRDVPSRLFEYVALLYVALRAGAAAIPPIESIAVVLSGRRRPWPAHGELRTGWPGSPFSGVRYRIEAVYQRTVAELKARGSVLWLVFVPLARDADLAAVREALEAIRAGAFDESERLDLVTALLVMANIDPWGQNMREDIVVMVETEWEDLFRAVPGLRDMFEHFAREDAVRQLLGRLFARRFGREATPEERRSIARQVHAVGAEQVEDKLLDLERDALLRWLAAAPPPAPRNATPARSRRRRR
jgi:hypothetical protein